MPLSWFSPHFQPFHLLPASKLHPSGADSQVGGFVYILGSHGPPSNGLFYDTGSFSHCHNPHRFLLPEVLRLSFPTLTLGFMICLAPQLSLPVYLHANVVPQNPPVTTLTLILSAPAVSTPPTGLNGCFFFNSLVVGLPYSSIFWHFWLFLFLNLLSFF